MKINKQELLDNMNKLMEKIGQDEVFARALAEKQTSAEVAEFLLANGISISEDTIDAVIENCTLRISTGVLNEIMTEAVAMQQPPSDKGKRLRLYYITQVSVKPPTFVIFVNDKELMHFSYTRYIENQIRDTFGFRGTPLRFIIRERNEKEQ